MEEKLDKLISLMEMQNKAWEKCLELLFSLAETMTADRKNKELLLEKHPETFTQKIFYSQRALKPYSFGHLWRINSLIACGFALSESKISFCAKVSSWMVHN